MLHKLPKIILVLMVLMVVFSPFMQLDSWDKFPVATGDIELQIINLGGGGTVRGTGDWLDRLHTRALPGEAAQSPVGIRVQRIATAVSIFYIVRIVKNSNPAVPAGS